MESVYITVGELAEHIGCQVLGNINKRLYGISLYQDSTDNTLTYIPYKKIDLIKDIHAGAILTRASIGLQLHRNYIITMREPYEQLADVVQFMIDKGIYNVPSQGLPTISESCTLAKNVSIGNGSKIGNYTKLSSGVVVSENVTIGENCYIGANTVIGDGCTIEDNVTIGSCCSIGTENFEYNKTRNGWYKIPAIGNVHICDSVTIGGNVVVERGTIGTTTIGKSTQIENLVQIGHEAKVGHHCHIVACVALAGWSQVGDHVDIYGQSAISNNVKVGNNVVLLARSGVDKDIGNNTIVSGFPAQNHKVEMRFQAFLRKLFRKNMKGCEIK